MVEGNDMYKDWHDYNQGTKALLPMATSAPKLITFRHQKQPCVTFSRQLKPVSGKTVIYVIKIIVRNNLHKQVTNRLFHLGDSSDMRWKT